jgi:hypothetical protein
VVLDQRGQATSFAVSAIAPIIRGMKRGMLAIVAAGLLTATCGGQARPAAETPKQVVAWKSVGSWSGRGNQQTESFTSGSGALRIRWTTTLANQPPDAAAAFRVTAHSAISGRLLEQAVDHHGAGSGVAYVNQDPHVFYLVVESDHVDWTVAVEEAIAGTVVTPH